MKRLYVTVSAALVLALAGVIGLMLATHTLPFAHAQTPHATQGTHETKCPTNTGASFYPSGSPVPTSTQCSMIYPPTITVITPQP